MVILDAGHGGTDPGGGSNQYWKEKDINLDISLYQYNRLRQLGIPVTLTRNSDTSLPPTERIAKVRSITPSSNEKNILVSNHVNIDYTNLEDRKSVV